MIYITSFFWLMIVITAVFDRIVLTRKQRIGDIADSTQLRDQTVHTGTAIISMENDAHDYKVSPNRANTFLAEMSMSHDDIPLPSMHVRPPRPPIGSPARSPSLSQHMDLDPVVSDQEQSVHSGRPLVFDETQLQEDENLPTEETPVKESAAACRHHLIFGICLSRWPTPTSRALLVCGALIM